MICGAQYPFEFPPNACRAVRLSDKTVRSESDRHLLGSLLLFVLLLFLSFALFVVVCAHDPIDVCVLCFGFCAAVVIERCSSLSLASYFERRNMRHVPWETYTTTPAGTLRRIFKIRRSTRAVRAFQNPRNFQNLAQYW